MSTGVQNEPKRRFRRWTRTRIAVAAIAVLGIGAAATVLFDGGGTPKAKAFVPPQVRAPRLTPDQYKAIIADVFGPQIDLGGRFEPGMRVAGLLTVGASSVSVTAAGMEQYDTMADAIAEQVVLDARNRKALLPCTPRAATAPDDACATQFLARAGQYLFRRPLPEDDLKAYVAAANSAAKTLHDFHGGLAMSLSAMLSSPQFLFRVPVVEPDPDRSGGFRLDAWSKASRLSFFLWNAAPDAQLMEAARNGELDSRRGLAKQVDRMMKSPRLEQGTRAFFSDMFQFDNFETLSKDSTIFPKFSRREMDDAKEQTLRTLVALLLDGNGDYRDAYTTKKTFLTPSLAAIYKVPLPYEGPNGGVEEWVPYEFAPDDRRAGILSHASFTALHSPPGRTSPTERGKALREVVMCQVVPAPPPDVQFTIVQNTDDPVNRTVRQRLLAHATVPSCAGCHKIMDPMGLALEHFDGSGEYRTVENGVPIDTSGQLDGVKFTDAIGLGAAVRNNPAVASCLVQRVTAYAFGQELAPGQQVFVRKLQAGFAENGYRLPDLLRAIASSPELYQAAAPAGVTTAALR